LTDWNTMKIFPSALADGLTMTPSPGALAP